jgi:nucleoside-triphosphatase THEP1
MRDEAGNRVGFKAKTSGSDEAVFAHKTAIKSDARIGSFGVDLDAIDEAFSKPIEAAMGQHALLVVDEIGRMQMLSPQFAQTIRKLLNSDADIIATIRYGDEWTHEFTGRPDALVITLTVENRAAAEPAVLAAIDGQPNFHKLTKHQQQAVIQMAKQYGTNDNLIQLKKLFKNAIKYVTDNKVKPAGEDAYIVSGDHDEHRVTTGQNWACDCDLFNGRNQFVRHAGECSHIQAVKLISTNHNER